MTPRSKKTAQDSQPRYQSAMDAVLNVRGGATPPRFQNWRSISLQMASCIALVWGLGNAAYVQLNAQENAALLARGDNRYSDSEVLHARRGQIFDRNGQLLASNVTKATVTLVGSQAKLSPEQKQRAAAIVGLSLPELEAKIAAAKSGLVYLRSRIDVEEGRKIKEALRGKKVLDRIPGIYVNDEFSRFYPQGEAASQLIGKVNLSGEVQDGLEKSLNDDLMGVDGERRYLKSGIGNAVEAKFAADSSDPINGSDVKLTIDKTLQDSVYSELRAAVLANEAQGGGAVVLNAQTGEVLALANYPSYDPNKGGVRSLAQLRNRVATDAFEPGSTMKPFTMALALQKGSIQPNTTYSGVPFMVNKLRVNDGEHGSAVLNLEQIIQRSSNVGAVRIANTLSNEEFHAGLVALGFGQPTKLPFLSSTFGKLRAPDRWRPVNKATIAYGYGVSTSLLQLARAYTVFTNKGEVLPLSIVHTHEAPHGVRVMQPEVAALVSNYMERVTQKEGTAPCAAVENFRTAGKTGTARKFTGSAYKERYIASFAGFAPASNPRVIVAVMIDEPGLKNRYYGGLTAAPVFSNIVTSAMRTLNVTPDGGAKPPCSAPLNVDLYDEVDET